MLRGFEATGKAFRGLVVIVNGLGADLGEFRGFVSVLSLDNMHNEGATFERTKPSLYLTLSAANLRPDASSSLQPLVLSEMKPCGIDGSLSRQGPSRQIPPIPLRRPRGLAEHTDHRRIIRLQGVFDGVSFSFLNITSHMKRGKTGRKWWIFEWEKCQSVICGGEDQPCRW
jgi:hypothetical protein